MRAHFLASVRSAQRLALAALLCFAAGSVGCGGDDGDGDGNAADADPNAPDADPNMTPDAPPGAPDAPAVGSGGLGEPCTGMGQGDCPGGFECLNLQTGNWCSKRCMGQADPICSEGYTGPGQPLCILGVDENNDGTADFSACTVVCQDNTPNGQICGAAVTCDGTCPGVLMCNGPIVDQNMAVVGQACQ